MRILFLSTLVKGNNPRDSITYGFIAREMQGLAKRGAEVFFFVRRSDRPPPLEGVNYVLLPGQQALRRRMLWFLLRYLHYFVPGLMRDFHQALQVLKSEAAVDIFLQEQGADLIHTHFLSPSGECCVLSAEKHNIPVIATLRGAELRNHPELNYGSMRSRGFRYMFSWAKNKLAYITAPNQELIQQLNSTYSLKAEKIQLLPNGVEMNPLSGVGHRQPSTKVRLVAVGWLTELKNHRVIIDALAKIDSRRIELTIIGEGDLENDLKQRIAEAKVDNVTIERNMPRARMLEKVAMSDCLVHPSLMEGMPNVVLESLFLGIPCIVSDISAHRGIIAENYNGFLFPTHDAGRLAGILERLINQPYLLTRMQANCLSASKNFTLDRKLDEYERIYKTILTAN